MKLLATIVLLIVTAEAARCRLKCAAPFIKNKEECTCQCENKCETYQVQNQTTCACEDKSCPPCEPFKGWDGPQEYFVQNPQPSCQCFPGEGYEPCDPFYGKYARFGLFNNTDGKPCQCESICREFENAPSICPCDGLGITFKGD